MLLRFNGVPARVAVGFTTGELESPGVYSVATNNAHAWVEAYFPTVGWVAFDPTPGPEPAERRRLVHQPGVQGPLRLRLRRPHHRDHRGARPTDLPNRPSRRTTPRRAAMPAPSWISTRPLAALGARPAGAAGRLAGRQEALAGERPAPRAPSTSASPPPCGCCAAPSSAYGVAATGSSTLEEVLDLIETHLGLEPRPGPGRPGGRRALRRPAGHDRRICERAEAFRREVEVRLRKRHGWVKTVLDLVRGAARGAGAQHEARVRRRDPAQVLAETGSTRDAERRIALCGAQLPLIYN